MTVRELIGSSLRLIGAIATGETPSADELSDGLSSVNRLLGRWSTEGLIVYGRVREEFTLTSNDGSYTIGSGANFNTTRPSKLEHVTIEDQSATPTSEYPVEIINQSQWAAIVQKDQTGRPTKLYPEGTFPNDTYNLWPVPNEADKLVLYSQKPLTAFASINSTVSLPTGYDDALVYNLAVRLAPEYGKTVTPELMYEANESKALIKKSNIKPVYLECDPGTLSTATTYDINLGE